MYFKEKKIKLDNLKTETDNVRNEMERLRVDNKCLMASIEQLKLDKQNSENQLNKINEKTRMNVFESAIDKAKYLITDSLAKFDDPVLLNCKSGAEYLLTLINPNSTLLVQMKQNFVDHKNDDTNGKTRNQFCSVLNILIRYANYLKNKNFLNW